MQIEFVSDRGSVGGAGALVFLAHEGAPLSGGASQVDAAVGGALTRAISASRFKASKGQVLDLMAPTGLDAGRIVLVGVGKAEAPGETDELAVEQAAASAYQALKASGLSLLALDLAGLAPSSVAHAALGVRLAAYRFDKYRTTEKPEHKPSVTTGRIVTAAVDERLDDRGFIRPGLGDAGDRVAGG